MCSCGLAISVAKLSISPLWRHLGVPLLVVLTEPLRNFSAIPPPQSIGLVFNRVNYPPARPRNPAVGKNYHCPGKICTLNPEIAFPANPSRLRQTGYRIVLMAHRTDSGTQLDTGCQSREQKDMNASSTTKHKRRRSARVSRSKATPSRDRSEEALDKALEDTYPASDPLAITQPGHNAVKHREIR